MTFYVNYITYLLVTLMSSVVRYSGHYNWILRTIQYYIPKLLYSIGIQQLSSCFVILSSFCGHVLYDAFVKKNVFG